MTKITEFRSYSDKSDSDKFAVVRIANSLVKTLGGRYNWIEIKNSDGKKIYRTIRGAGDRDIRSHQMELDYDSILELGLNIKKSESSNAKSNMSGYSNCDVKISRVGLLTTFRAHLKHPDPAYRVPMILAFISLLIGFISFAIGLFALFHKY